MVLIMMINVKKSTVVIVRQVKRVDGGTYNEVIGPQLNFSEN